MSGIRLRRASLEDAPAIAEIHIASWRETYDRMMPAETLAGLDVAEWAENWRARLADQSDSAAAVFLTLDEAGAPAGFAFCRRQHSEKLLPLGYEGEIASVYLLRRLQRRGAGRRLLAAMSSHLLANDCRSAAVWVFQDAPHARRFYESHGAAPTGVAGVWEIFGMTLPDLALGWRDIAPLASLAER